MQSVCWFAGNCPNPDFKATPVLRNIGGRNWRSLSEQEQSLTLFGGAATLAALTAFVALAAYAAVVVRRRQRLSKQREQEVLLSR